MARGPSAEDSPAARYARHLHSRHPRFLTAVAADARATSANRGVPLTGRSRAAVLGAAVKLAWESDAFAAQACYRAKRCGRNRVESFMR